MLYMVFTNAGQFRAVSLFPGNYEINVVSNDLESEVQKLILKAGDNPRLKLSLRAPAAGAALETAREAQAYDEIYPPGPGRDVAERTCMVCHGENFLALEACVRGGVERPHRSHDGHHAWREACLRVRRRPSSIPRHPERIFAEGSPGLGCLRSSRISDRPPNRAASASTRKCRWMNRSSARRCTSSTTCRRTLRVRARMPRNSQAERTRSAGGVWARMCVSTRTAMCG